MKQFQLSQITKEKIGCTTIFATLILKKDDFTAKTLKKAKFKIQKAILKNVEVYLTMQTGYQERAIFDNEKFNCLFWNKDDAVKRFFPKKYQVECIDQPNFYEISIRLEDVGQSDDEIKQILIDELSLENQLKIDNIKKQIDELKIQIKNLKKFIKK